MLTDTGEDLDGHHVACALSISVQHISSRLKGRLLAPIGRPARLRPRHSLAKVHRSREQRLQRAFLCRRPTDRPYVILFMV